MTIKLRMIVGLMMSYGKYGAESAQGSSNGDVDRVVSVVGDAR
jgi:hypothetical protein